MTQSTIISTVAMLAVLALGWGGARLIVACRDRRKGVLMLVAAVVLLANVLIWAAPLPS